ncbi:hypothetical protein B7494_g6828 [Chlorociboria aeruginascens]|nr:hypothetical protein B7494_g6828 [Chlorociboria aeruginascens]
MDNPERPWSRRFEFMIVHPTFSTWSMIPHLASIFDRQPNSQPLTQFENSVHNPVLDYMLDEVDGFAAELFGAFTEAYRSLPPNTSNTITDPISGHVMSSDASFANNEDTMFSSQGGTYQLLSGIIDWTSQVQKTEFVHQLGLQDLKASSSHGTPSLSVRAASPRCSPRLHRSAVHAPPRPMVLHPRAAAHSHSRESVKEHVPLVDYLLCYDRGGFWVGRYAFRYFITPFNRMIRFLLDRFMHSRVMYHALHASGQSRMYLIQDVNAAPAFQEHDTFGLYPLWLCPLRQRRDAGRPKARYGLYASLADPKASSEFMMNFGVWGPGSKNRIEFVRQNRLLEHKVDELGGRKWLYAHAYYTQDEFWSIYDRTAYDALRAKYSYPGVVDGLFAIASLEHLATQRAMWRIQGVERRSTTISLPDLFYSLLIRSLKMKPHGPFSLFFSILPITTILTTIFAYEPTSHAPTNEFHIRRDFETCQETYGGGSENCGDADDHFCYDPTLGEGEDPDTCARQLSFTLPPSASTTLIADPVSTSINVPTLSDTTETFSTDLQIAAVTSSSIDPATENEVHTSTSHPSSGLATAILVDTSSLEFASPTDSIAVVTTMATLAPDVTAPTNASISALQVTGGVASLRGDFGVEIGVSMLGVVAIAMLIYG